MPADYENDEESSAVADSEEEEGNVKGFAAMSHFVPHRLQQVMISWIFIIASVMLLLDFFAFQDLIRTPPTATLGYFAALCNWFGVVSCVHWLGGFILLAHWLHTVGATQLGLLGCYCKVVASIFFNLQPMTGTMGLAALGGGAGLWWSNATGITFFHVGNLISCYDMWANTPPGANKKEGWMYHGNLPITGMWVYQAATWFLVGSNYMAISPPGSTSLVVPSDWKVYTCQVLGGGFLLLGSLVYGLWSDAFGNCSHASS